MLSIRSIRGKHLVTVVVLALLAVGCGKSDRGTSNAVTIGTFSQAIDYAPFYVASHFGWFSDSTSADSIVYREFGRRQAISNSLSSGELDLFFAAGPPVLITSAQGNEIVVGEISCTLQQQIAVRKSLDVQNIPDLTNRTVAVLDGTSSHYGLLRVLERYNVDSDDVDIRMMIPDAAEAAFEKDQIDAWAVWPPWVQRQVVFGNGHVIKGGEQVIHSLATFRSDFVTNHSRLAQQMASVVRDAKRWIQTHPSEAQSIIVRELELRPEVVELAWPKHDWGARLDSTVVTDFKKKQEFLADRDLLRTPIPATAQELIAEGLGGMDEL